jgi:hypothetical protein
MLQKRMLSRMLDIFAHWPKSTGVCSAVLPFVENRKRLQNITISFNFEQQGWPKFKD